MPIPERNKNSIYFYCMIAKELIAQWFKTLQDEICHSLEQFDGKGKFKEDQWKRPGGGGGRTRIINGGNVIEKGGVNFSAVFGKMPEKIAKGLGLSGDEFYATGVSIVLHPNNPHVPIIHMNVRYFEMSNKTWWFGGGIDLTPHYIDKDEAVYFHQQMKNVCHKHDPEFYSAFKKWADEYFYIKHRKESRGIGGIFFDKLNQEKGKTQGELFEFVKSVGQSFAPTYIEIATKKRDLVPTEEEKKWQMLRRGRYVEFNLVYDRGTKFGLETDGRIESILMSLPENAGWTYNYQPKPGSREEETLRLLHEQPDWL